MPLSSSTIMRRNKPKVKEPDSRELNNPPLLRNNNKSTKTSIIQSRRKIFLVILVVFVLIILLLSPNKNKGIEKNKVNNDNYDGDDNNDNKNKSEKTQPINKTNNIRKQPTTITTAKKSSTTTSIAAPPTTNASPPKCTFRKYVPRRHYQLDSTPPPPFLQNAKYIFGLPPTILSPLPTPPRKICVDTTSWDSSSPNNAPFSDGQNLSIVSLRPYPSPHYDKRQSPRLDPVQIEPLRILYGSDVVENNYYLSVNYVGDSQCRWKETPEELSTYGISSLSSPPSIRTVILLLDESFHTVAQRDLRVDFDGVNKWGTKSRGKGRSVEALDDPRFFFAGGKLWVLFRVGKVFGYEEQVQAPVHFELTEDGTDWEVFVTNGEVVRVGLGRNIAIIGDELSSFDGDGGGTTPTTGDGTTTTTMKGVLLIDPLTVVPMTTSRSIYKIRMGATSSHIHGTNGYMIPLHDSGEFLGVGHFHRPYNRDSSDYARHGHHYTHAFFTIAPKEGEEDGGGAKGGEEGKGYYLKRLSREFLFPSMSKEGDADVIQFASGLEMVGGERDGRLLISYGINDCEGAAVWLDMTVVQEMLKEVRKGSEVAEYMTITEGYDESLEKK